MPAGEGGGCLSEAEKEEEVGCWSGERVVAEERERERTYADGGQRKSSWLGRRMSSRRLSELRSRARVRLENKLRSGTRRRQLKELNVGVYQLARVRKFKKY